MFFFGRRSEVKETPEVTRHVDTPDLTPRVPHIPQVKEMPKVTYDNSASFEACSRWNSHFQMRTLLAVDIVCAAASARGAAAMILAHVACLQSSFVRERTHLLFDIAHREANTRMVKFAASIGAARCQTFADEARSEGFIGVEGDDPSIYWTYKTPAGFGPNENKTAGVYAAARR